MKWKSAVGQMTHLGKIGTVAVLGLVAVLVLLLMPGLPGCGSYQSCEEDLDCLILCDCAGLDGTISVGPYTCRSTGTCGRAHWEDMDCVRPCAEAAPALPSFDDDDSGATNDDDDSGVATGDDDSARR